MVLLLLAPRGERESSAPIRTKCSSGSRMAARRMFKGAGPEVCLSQISPEQREQPLPVQLGARLLVHAFALRETKPC